MDLLQSARSVLLQSLEDANTSQCPDHAVGVLARFDVESSSFPSRIEIDPVQRESESKLIVILESPHTKEFSEPIGPAKGKTGSNLVKYFRATTSLSFFNNHQVLLVNAIQYQCSLGKSTNQFRDEVFRKMWEDGGRCSLVERLSSYYQIGDTVINCCTKGSSAPYLRDLVQCAIEEIVPKLRIIKLKHPASWHFPANRELGW